MTQYNLIIKTGDVSGAGTDANVQVSLAGQGNLQSQWFDLDKSWYNDFERADQDGYIVEPNKGLGELTALFVQMDMSGLGAAWYLDWIIVEEVGTEKKWRGEPPYHWFDVEYSTDDSGPKNTTSQAIHLQRDDKLVVPKPPAPDFGGLVGGI